MTLVVCNPNKAREEETAAAATSLAPAATTPARSPTPTPPKEEKSEYLAVAVHDSMSQSEKLISLRYLERWLIMFLEHAISVL